MGLLAVIMAAGLVAAVVRGAVGSGAKSLRGRLRAVAWNVALMILSVMLAGSFRLVPFVVLVIPAAAMIVIGWPRLVKRAIVVGLIALGLCGFMAGRTAGFGFGFGFENLFYGFPFAGAVHLAFYLLPTQVYLFLLLGGWLGWRSADRTSARVRRLLGRLAEPGLASRPWGLLLLPVAIMAAALFVPIGFGYGPAGLWWPVLILAAVIQFIRKSPQRAAATAVAGLIAFGLAGIYLVVHGSWSFPAHNGAGYVAYGLVDVTSRAMAGVALVEALACIGAGLWLMPRAAPGMLSDIGGLTSRDLAQRVKRLTEARAVAVDTAAADLRRLERDLHDGAQARLVALGMNLRAVERLIPTSPDAALALVAEARETSARALTELRELVRGVHPPVLADRGLGDAILALALDSPLQIETEIDLPGKLPAPIETACYFAVAEVLTNAAKHSGARSARLTAAHDAGVLRISVTDFGLGGADPASGTGLAGVERRLASFDGLVAVSSPVGGPTIVVIEVPCALSRAAEPAR